MASVLPGKNLLRAYFGRIVKVSHAFSCSLTLT